MTTSLTAYRMRRIPPISFSRAVEQQDDSLLPNSIRKLCYKKKSSTNTFKIDQNQGYF